MKRNLLVCLAGLCLLSAHINCMEQPQEATAPDGGQMREQVIKVLRQAINDQFEKEKLEVSAEYERQHAELRVEFAKKLFDERLEEKRHEITAEYIRLQMELNIESLRKLNIAMYLLLFQYAEANARIVRAPVERKNMEEGSNMEQITKKIQLHLDSIAQYNEEMRKIPALYDQFKGDPDVFNEKLIAAKDHLNVGIEHFMKKMEQLEKGSAKPRSAEAFEQKPEASAPQEEAEQKDEESSREESSEDISEEDGEQDLAPVPSVVEKLWGLWAWLRSFRS